MKSVSRAAVALSLGSTAYAAISKQCPSSNVCYSLSIPETTANSGDGDIFFQLSAPTSYEWVALGQGSSMTGSNIFVMYTSSDGKNVTVSPRLGTGHVMPEHDTAAKITVLSGSGVSNDIMTANVQCSNCNSWSGGTMDFTSSSADWIYALKSGSALNSDSLTETIVQHDTAAPFTWDISDAKGGSDVNPFVSTSGSTGSTGGSSNSGSSSAASSGTVPSTCTPIAASSAAGSNGGSTAGSGTTATLAGPSGSGCPTSWPARFSTSWPATRPTWAATCHPSGHGAGPWPTHPPQKEKRDDGCPSGYESISSGSLTEDGSGGLSLSQQKSMLLAHGVLACIAFVALFPIGGILIRLANFTGLIWVHAALQLFGYLVYIIAFIMGVYMATHMNLMSNSHPIIGIALFMILLLQPIFGFLHHRLFKKYGHRTLWSYAHLWHGRVAILLGMVNGGLGLKLAGVASMGQKIAYGVIAALMAVIYIAAIIVGELRRRKKTPPSYEKSQRSQSHQLRDMSSSEENVQAGGDYYGKGGQPFRQEGA